MLHNIYKYICIYREDSIFVILILMANKINAVKVKIINAPTIKIVRNS